MGGEFFVDMPHANLEPVFNYAAFLENPVFFVLFSNQAVEGSKAHNQYFGNSGRCITVRLSKYGAVQSASNEMLEINMIEQAGKFYPCFNQAYTQGLERAVRRTKQHKYHNRNDIVVCVVLDSENHDVSIGETCRRIYQDLETAYFNHIYFDFYFMISEEFTVGGSLGQFNIQILEDLEAISSEEWVRYIFLISDITSEELAIASVSEQFQAVLNSVILTNCSSSTGAGSAVVNERLTMENQDLRSKFLSLGRIELSLEHDLIQDIVRHTLLEEVFHLPPGKQKTANIPLSTTAMRSGIESEVRRMSTAIEKIAGYRCMTSLEAAECTNQEVISTCFHTNPENFMMTIERRLSEVCGQRMQYAHYEQIISWMDNILHQIGVNLCDIDCCRAVYREACQEVQRCRQENERTRCDNEQQFSLWKNEKVQVRRWWKWFRAHNWQLQVLEKWTEFKSIEQECRIFEQCLSDIETYIGSWLRTKENLYSSLESYRFDAAAVIRVRLNDCCDTKRCLAGFYQQELQEYLKEHQEIPQRFRQELESLLEQQTDLPSLTNCIRAHTRRLHTNWMYGPRTHVGNAAELSGMCEALYSSLLKRTVLYMRGQAINIEPYICVMGRRANALIEYIYKQESAHILVFDTEFLDAPWAFYYQNIRGLKHMPSCQIHRRRATSGVEN